MRKIAILGSTGSIGRQTLDVVRAFPDRLRVVALAANRNARLLETQLKQFQPKLFYCSAKAEADYGAEFVPMEEIASHAEVDLVVVATAGKAGLTPTVAALQAGKTVALASKEVLVMAGEIVVDEASIHGARILPVDSEHSAVWQCLQGEKSKPRQLFLTASGGPFYRYSPSQLAGVTPKSALRHPVWRMGARITIDSATLMNKGLEVIEAHWLFSFPFDSIRVLIHPQSIVHSMVEFVDGSIKAQLGWPDMRLPIQYALSYPERWANSELPRLDWNKSQSLEFEPVDYERFPSVKLAIEAGRLGGTYPAVLCAADEVAVELFLAGKIAFTDVPKVVATVLEHHKSVSRPSLNEILAADAWAREYALRLCPTGGKNLARELGHEEKE